MFVRGAYLSSRANRITIFVALLAIVAAIWGSVSRRWLCDDAFISFRYAENLVRGAGLVFNPNEYVEGYTNFLWTLWIALGLAAGFNPEIWAIVWGIIFYIATIFLLIVYHFHLKRDLNLTGLTLPVAALLASIHTDWNIYATSGLETSFFTFLLVAGYTVLVEADGKRFHFGASGLLFALASLVRPDGVLFAIVAFLFVLSVEKPRIRAALFFSLPLLGFCIPYLLWRNAYYGDIFPNTYYAKSANIPWYSQGAFYFWLYFQKYWILLAGIAFAIALFLKNSGRLYREAALALGFILVYSFYVIRVGGDFMFARLLIPVTPFFMILIELGMSRFLVRRSYLYVGVVATMCIAMLYSADRMSGPGGVRGITNEWFYYKNVFPNWGLETKRKAEILKRYFAGLPVRLAYFGGEARLMYYLRPEVAIECETGLTDAYIAHLPLAKRGRIGHEKKAPPDYLILQRKLHFSFAPHAAETLKLNQAIPNVEINFDGIRARVLHWDPEVMAILHSRGARFVDFPHSLDEYLKHIQQLPREKLAADFQKLDRFYFHFVQDPVRKKAIQAAISQ